MQQVIWVFHEQYVQCSAYYVIILFFYINKSWSAIPNLSWSFWLCLLIIDQLIAFSFLWQLFWGHVPLLHARGRAGEHFNRWDGSKYTGLRVHAALYLLWGRQHASRGLAVSSLLPHVLHFIALCAIFIFGNAFYSLFYYCCYIFEQICIILTNIWIKLIPLCKRHDWCLK